MSAAAGPANPINRDFPEPEEFGLAEAVSHLASQHRMDDRRRRGQSVRVASRDTPTRKDQSRDCCCPDSPSNVIAIARRVAATEKS